MKLLTLNDEKMPTISAEALTIKCFADLWRRLNKIEGDYNGAKKTRNVQEIGYIYFTTVWDSRFKLKTDQEKEAGVKKLVGLPPEWIPDKLVKECQAEYEELQKSASYHLVTSLEGSTYSVSMWIKSKKAALEAGTLDPGEVKQILDIIDKAPTTIETLAKAKSVMHKEQDALATGRKGRTTNKFEMPDA